MRYTGNIRRLLILIIIWGAFSTVAQESNNEIVNFGEYWSQLQSTKALIEQAIGQPEQRQAIVEQIDILWRNVEQVRLPNESLMEIDTDWLIFPSNIGTQELQNIQNRIEALIAYSETQFGGALSDADAFNRLDEIMQDERFQYQPNVVPTSAPASNNSSNVNVSPAFNIGELIPPLFMLIAIAIIVAFVVSLTRNMRLQSTANYANGTEEDDPTTSIAAEELAKNSEQERDYRAAIRYLYLASLLLLDERGLLRYDPTMTNREHLKQISDKPKLSELLSYIVNVFDDVWYGFAPVDENLYQNFRQQINQLQSLTPQSS